MEMKGKKITEKIINIVLNVLIYIFGIILLISIYNNLQVKVFGKDYSDFFGYSIFEVQTGSMKNYINPGDWIIVKSSSDIKLKDVITYKQGEDFITHRVIGVYNDTFVTKGDANNTKDDPIDKKQIVGKVVKIIPHFGILKKTIFNPAVLVAVIITILMINFLFKNKNKEQKQVSESKMFKKISDKLANNMKDKRNKKLKIKKEKEELKKKYEQEKLQQKLESEIKQEEIIKEALSNEIVSEPENIEEISSFIPVDVSELDETFLEIA